MSKLVTCAVLLIISEVIGSSRWKLPTYTNPLLVTFLKQLQVLKSESLIIPTHHSFSILSALKKPNIPSPDDAEVQYFQNLDFSYYDADENQFPKEEEGQYTLFTPPKEAYMSTPELIKNLGYKVENHTVLTDDGYILTLFRIPQGSSPNYDARNSTLKGPVFLLHGLLCSSDDWLLHLHPQDNLPILLADLGYDVWLGNSRGNSYSMKHISLSPDDYPFWNFSLDELARYDTPAIFKYILNFTKVDQLIYVGHSMGTTSFFIAMNMYPELQAKVTKMFALAPVVYLRHTLTPLRILSKPNGPIIETLLGLMSRGRVFPKKLTAFVRHYGPVICEGDIPNYLCSSIMFLFGGFDHDQFTAITSSMVLGHTPSPTSGHAVNHFLQWVRDDRFEAFDYGPKENLKRYNSTRPHLYKLSNVHVPVYTFHAQNDWLNVAQDSDRFLKELAHSIVVKKTVSYEQFNHLDFLYAKDVRKLLYNQVLEYF